jgi:hypothetical protein
MEKSQSKLLQAMKSLHTVMDGVRVKQDKEKFLVAWRKTIILPQGIKPVCDELDKLKKLKLEDEDTLLRGGNNSPFGDLIKAGLLYMMKYCGLLDESWDGEIEKWLNRTAILKDEIARLRERGEFSSTGDSI